MPKTVRRRAQAGPKRIELGFIIGGNVWRRFASDEGAQIRGAASAGERAKDGIGAVGKISCVLEIGFPGARRGRDCEKAFSSQKTSLFIGHGFISKAFGKDAFHEALGHGVGRAVPVGRSKDHIVGGTDEALLGGCVVRCFAETVCRLVKRTPGQDRAEADAVEGPYLGFKAGVPEKTCGRSNEVSFD